MTRLLRIYPSLLRVGFAEALAYRAEFLVWVLTTNLPLINLALWSAVARDAPVGGFGQADFAAYFLATLVVRLLTNSWVVWELTMEIRQGTLATKLLRPMHPLVIYSAENLAALPMRAAIALPIALVMLWATGPEYLSDDTFVWALMPVMLALAWLMTFLVMAIIGTLAFYLDSASSVYEVWLGLFTILSGYLVPLELFPDWLREIARVLPFRLMLGFPVESLLGRLGREEVLAGLAMQVGWVVVFAVLARMVWRAGMRRFAAFGG